MPPPPPPQAVAEARDMLRSGQYDTAYKQLTTVLAEEEEEAGRLEVSACRVLRGCTLQQAALCSHAPA